MVSSRSSGSMWVIILVTLLLCVPTVILRLGYIAPFGTLGDTAVFGLGIVAAAFILAWAAEASEVDISQGLAVAAVALIAVLPEYAVDMTFAWKAAQDPTFAPFAVANMTGGNRLLIGAAWPFVFFIFWLRARRTVLKLERGHAIEVLALAVATIYSFSLPLKGYISVVDTGILALLFVGYVYFVARMPSEEPQLIGPARTLGTLPKMQRRTSIVLLLLAAAATIFAAAEPFAEGLVHSGVQLGIDEFLLVQWLAPLASEAPEFLFAGILAYRGRAGVAMGALLSSKVNQWTLLIGGLPLAYSISGGHLEPLPLDARQVEEVLLTAAQSAFALAVMVSLSMSATEAMLLFGLFIVQFAVPNTEFRLFMSGVYLVLAAAIFIRNRREAVELVHHARTAHLEEPARHA